MVPKKIKLSQLRHHWEVYLFIIPTLLLIGLLQYYPAASGIFHSFFRWNGADIAEYVGLDNFTDLLHSAEFWNSFKVAFILGAWNILKMLPPLLVAVCIHRCRSERVQFFYRCLFVIPMVLPGLIVAMIWRTFFFEASTGYLNQLLYATGLHDLLCWLDRTLQWGTVVEGHYQGVFTPGAPPNWLGDPKLMLTAIIVWGFPWVGSFAVLTHLAKLQNISKDVYEAAAIDGVSWWTKFTRIELPLITGSIYLMLVFTIIDTIKDAATVLVLADMNGGPGGVVAVPALFMLRKAFMDNQMGYACAIGIVLTIIVMSLQKVSTLFLDWDELAAWQRVVLRAGAGAVGLVLLYFGTLTVLAAIILLLAFPYGPVGSRLRRLFGGGGRGDAAAADRERRMRLARERRATPLHRACEAAGTFCLRSGKHVVVWTVLACAAPAVLTLPLHFENWSFAWSTVSTGVANSIYLSICTTLCTLVFALSGAYFFARVRMPMSGFFWNALLILMMMPTVANLVPLFRLLSDLNLVNTLSALILAGTAAGQVFSIFVLRNFVADIPQDLFEAAEIDGASHFQQLKTIVLPLSGTILGTVGVMLFISQWNDFILPLIVMRDEIRYPIMVQLQRLNGSYVKEVGPLMAGFAIASIPVIILFIFSMKLFIKGMTEGAVKG
ncbi:MAG: ABC transporter permease subunit [Planctomycetota bacterium]|nr:ABC transporter permease subunit [Planctomycetota bacterium]